MATIPTTKSRDGQGLGNKPTQQRKGTKMGTAVHQRQGTLFSNTNENPNTGVHTTGKPETKAPQRPGAKKLPTKVTWIACQAVRYSLDGKRIEFRSFPFWALSLEHARSEMIEMAKQEGGKSMVTHVISFGEYTETMQHHKMKVIKGQINIETGAKK